MTASLTPLKRSLLYLTLGMLFICLPFVILIRGSQWLITAFNWNIWFSLLIAAIACILLIIAYLTSIYQRLSKTKATRRHLKWIALLSAGLILTYCLFSLVFLSNLRGKTSHIDAELHAVHPVLILATQTLTLLDGSIIITDATRELQNYRAFGLPENNHSLHLIQPTGYSHAIDIRTQHNGEIRNRLIQLYFWLLGFHTKRHTGTADHLHVALST